MNEKYYLAVFNEETWEEFLKNGSSVYGTTLNKQRRMEATNPSDFLICYVTKLSCFVGLLEITSKAYLENRIIWKNGIYPVRVDVHPVYVLKAENGIPVLELKDELAMFDNIKNPKHWGVFFLNSLIGFQENDAKLIVDKLKESSEL